MLGGKTHDEPTTLVVVVLLQRHLTQRLGKVVARNPGTHLIIHYGVTDVLNQVAEFIHISGAVQGPCNPAPPFQWDEVLKDVIKFSEKLCESDWGIGLGEGGLLFEDFPSPFLLDLTLGNRRTQRFRQLFNSGYQRFYRLAARGRLLG